jgi:hypothetical protein
MPNPRSAAGHIQQITWMVNENGAAMSDPNAGIRQAVLSGSILTASLWLDYGNAVGSVTRRRWRGRFLRQKSALFSLQADRRHHTGAISGLRKNHLKVKESRFRQDIG